MWFDLEVKRANGAVREIVPEISAKKSVVRTVLWSRRMKGEASSVVPPAVSMVSSMRKRLEAAEMVVLRASSSDPAMATGRPLTSIRLFAPP
jgi:hypothetical protein